jgi:hypothetical protein
MELIVLWEPVEHFIITILPREAATSRGMNAFRKARARGAMFHFPYPGA